MKKQFKICLTAVMAIFMLWGCDKGETATDPLASVPADAVAVARADFRKLITEAGCVPVDGRYEITPVIQGLLASSDTSTLTLVSLLADIAPETDLSSVYWYIPSSGAKPVVTLQILDADALMKRLSATAVASVKIADYNVYTFSGASAVVRDSQLWIARSADMAMEANDIAASAPFSADKVKSEALKAEADIVAVLQAGQLDIPGADLPSGAFVTASARCLRSGFYLNAYVSAPDGTPVYIGADMKPVDTSFASLMPRQTAACLALGSLDWRVVYPAALAALGDKLGDNGRMVLSMLRPYIESIDGTVAVAVAPAAGTQSLGELSLSSWEVFLSASMPQEKLDQLTTLISAMASMSDFPCRSNGDGTYALVLEDCLTLTVGSIDGKFVIANYDLSVAGVQRLVPHLDNRVALLDVDIPYDGDLARVLHMPWGVSVDAGIASGVMDATIKLNGIKMPPLKALLEGRAK
ncbi:MAG: hypothetical protein K2F61_06090 [Muribaculaceae bacterium]|nr:hypothetical protein [Muribaculaceae bacterium]